MAVFQPVHQTVSVLHISVRQFAGNIAIISCALGAILERTRLCVVDDLIAKTATVRETSRIPYE